MTERGSVARQEEEMKPGGVELERGRRRRWKAVEEAQRSRSLSDLYRR